MGRIPNGHVLRGAAIAVALASALMGAAWYEGAAWAVATLPWSEVPMTFVFLASIAASIAMVWLAVAWTGEWATLAGVGLNMAVAGALAAWALASAGHAAPALAVVAVAAFGVLLFVWARALPVHDLRAMPGFVRAAFVVFAVVLIGAGGALTLGWQVFPWRLQDTSTALVGAVFLGAAAYFAHASTQTRWTYALPVLAGFLVYDLVLFVPYLQLFGTGGAAADDLYGGGGDAVNWTSLAIYLTVLATSAALALYCLLFHPATRLVRGRDDGPA